MLSYIRLLSLLLLLMLHCAVLHAHNEQLADSLTKALTQLPERDTTRIHVYNKLGRIYMTTDAPRARGYLQQSLTLAQSMHFGKGEAEVYNVLAMIYDHEGNYRDAGTHYHTAISIASKLDDPLKTAKLWDNLGGLLMREGRLDSAHIAFQKSLQLKEPLGDVRAIALTLDQIGNLHLMQSRYKQAVAHYLKALRMKESIPDNDGPVGISYLLLAAAYYEMEQQEEALKYYDKALAIKKNSDDLEALLAIYLNRSFLYTDMKRFDEALADNQAALEILKTNTNVAAMTGCYNSMGGIYKAMGRTEDALKYFRMALQISVKAGDNNMTATLCNSIGEMLTQQGRFSAALSYLEDGRAAALAADVPGYLKENYLASAAAYEGMGDYRSAYRYHKLFSDMRDSLLNKTSTEQVAEMREKYESEKKEREILQLSEKQQTQQLVIEKRNRQLAMSAGAITLLVLFGLLLFGYIRVRQRSRLALAAANTEKVRAETILETEQAERRRIAKDLHDELGSGISRIVLSNELAKKHINGNGALNSTLMSIDRTVSELAGNMNSLIWALQTESVTLGGLMARMREYGSDFFEDSSITPHFTFSQVPEDMAISRDMLKDIFLVYKEALNNALKYSQASRIDIEVTLDNTTLRLCIADNGTGLEIPVRSTGGNGIRNMKHRIERYGGHFNISGAETGTVINVEVPV